MHLERLPSGSWRATVKHQGRRRSVTRRTREEARFAGAADMRRIRTRLPADFLERTVASVTPSFLSSFYRRLVTDGWTPGRVARAHALLSAVWKHAVMFGWTSTNPCGDARASRVEAPDVTPPGHDHVAALLRSATGVEAVAFRLAATTGCRRGEVVAVQWGDVDLDDGELVVRRSLVHTPDSGVQERQTKTGQRGHRVLALDQGTVRRLRDHRQHQLERAVANGLPAPVWVISTDAGVTPWRPDLLTHRYIAARRRAGMPDTVRLQDLRHDVATTMLEDGEPDIDVAAQLGHTSISTTQRTYAHFMPGRGRESAEARARRLGDHCRTGMGPACDRVPYRLSGSSGRRRMARGFFQSERRTPLASRPTSSARYQPRSSRSSCHVTDLTSAMVHPAGTEGVPTAAGAQVGNLRCCNLWIAYARPSCGE